MSLPNSPRNSLANTLLLAAATLWCIYWFVHAWPYWEDDAYIHLEFARSLAAHHGFAFNGRVVAGDTAPLWVLLLAAMHSMIPNWLVAGKVLTIPAALLGLAGTYAFAKRLAEPLGLTLFPAALVLLLVVNPFFCYWVFSGMEPIAAVGVAFFAVLAATTDFPNPRNFLVSCLLAGIAPLLRPEMIFLTAILSVLLLIRWTRLNTAKLPTFAAGLVLLAGPLTAWSIYSLHAFGHFIPNTNAAKRAAPHDSVVGHLVGIYSLGFPIVVCGVLAGILYLLLRPTTVRRAAQRSIQSAIASAFSPTAAASRSLPLAGWIFILWSLITTLFYLADHTYVQTRYILVTAPGLTVVLVYLATAASRRIGRAVYTAALLASLIVSVVTVRPFIRNKGINCQVNDQIAFFIRDHTPPTAPVATYAIGQIAFVSEHPIIDTGGITRPGAIPYLNDPPEAMLRWARSEGAQYYITDKPDAGAVLAFSIDQRFIGWTLHTSRYATSETVQLWKLAAAPSGGY